MPRGVTTRRQRLSPMRLVRRAAFYRGLLGGNRRWMAVGGALWFGRAARRALGRNEQHVSLDRLRAGEALEIRTIPPDTRWGRRALARAAADRDTRGRLGGSA